MPAQNALVAYKNDEIANLTRRFKTDRRAVTHMPIFNLFDFMVTVSKNGRDLGLELSDPIHRFQFRDVYMIPDSSNTHGDLTFKDGLKQRIYHGYGAGDIKPYFDFRFFNGQYFYTSKNEYFGDVSAEKSTFDQEEFLAAMLDWIYQCAPNFKIVYQQGLAAGDIGGPSMADIEAMRQKTERDVEDARIRVIKERIYEDKKSDGSAGDMPELKGVDLDSGESGVSVMKADYDVFDANEIIAATKDYNFCHKADVLLWGQRAEHLASEAIRNIQAEAIIVSEARVASLLQLAVDNARSHLASFAKKKFLGRTEKRLRGYFGEKVIPPELSVRAYMIETQKCFEQLMDAIEGDINICLEQVGRVELETEDMPNFEASLSTHTEAFRKASGRAVRDLGRKRLQGNKKIAVERIQLIRQEHQLKSEAMGNSLETWRGFELGIENYISCKYGQYENLRILRKKIDTDFKAILLSKLGQAPNSFSKSDDVDVYNKGVSDMLGNALEVVQMGRQIIDELQDIVRIGKDYDVALVERKAEDIRRISRKERYKPIEFEGVKLLPHPSQFPSSPSL